MLVVCRHTTSNIKRKRASEIRPSSHYRYTRVRAHADMVVIEEDEEEKEHERD